MNRVKKAELDKAYNAFLDAMKLEFPVDRLDEYVIPDVMGYGTTVDERIFDYTGLLNIIEMQEKQSENIQFGMTVTPVHRKIAENENSAVFVDEVLVSMELEDGLNEFTARVSTVLDYIDGKWKVIHWHGSKAVDAEGDTWHKEEWKQQNEKLKKQVKEKTADLEQKNRELEIEAALERVRATAMGMNKQGDLMDVVKTLLEEFTQLGFPGIRDAQIDVLNDEKRSFRNYRHSDYGVSGVIEVLYDSHPQITDYINDVKSAQDAFSHFEMKGKELDEWRAFRRKDNHLEDFKLEQATALYYYNYSVGTGALGISTFQPLEEDKLIILKRFRNVFHLAYQRFTDIEKAEAQAREAKIEAALERVRSMTMAMHNSQDVGKTVIAMFDEVLKLGIDKSIRCGLGILNKETDHMETWSATSFPDGEVDLKMGLLNMTIHPMLIGLKKAWENGEPDYHYNYIGEDVVKYYKALNKEPEYPFHRDLNALPEKEYHRSFFFTEGILFSFAPDPISEEAASVLSRFASVFGQTYRRYLDLKNAEAQAREAQIEAALERVRSKAMAMHSSEDLGLTVDAFFNELKGLDVYPHRCGVGIVNGETRVVRIQAIDTNNKDETKKIIGDLKLAGHPVLDKIFESWKLQKEYFPVLRGEEIMEYYKVMNPQVKFHDFADDEVQYGYYFYFKEGGVYAWTDKQLQEQDIQIFRRYTSVLSLTYRRYLDLIRAEVQAREATKQAALDRVRGEIASMRSPEDLRDITPLIWSELETLEVPFIRCGIFIIDEIRTNVQAYLSTPDGKSLGVLNLPFDTSELISNTIDFWKKKKVYTHHWNKEDFIQWMQSLISLGQVQTPEEYQGNIEPPESLDLHFIPFKQGMLYVGNIEPLEPEKIDLVKTLAEAFSIAYARYEDFLQLKEAKSHVEKTLHELKSTQSQLIHAEKMASLGELTAGIAHEIQNPLNFVNNFSEVSADLIDEMREELVSGDIEEANAISSDLKQNLEKITYHGQRASAIVKGMLEHSRAGDGHKEPTNINELADEYLRLAYHGLRAKDKTFNADFNTELDDSLPRINVVPQDIGRVLLNLINNAFHAVSSSEKGHVSDFKPVVKVKTQRVNELVEITVQDNGDGIPADLKEKIFQPFFTTKPSGEGTGLGLSLSFDIIKKGHEGDITVKSKQGEGTEFIIVLPIN